MSHNLFKIKLFLHKLLICIKALSNMRNSLTHAYNIHTIYDLQFYIGLLTYSSGISSCNGIQVNSMNFLSEVTHNIDYFFYIFIVISGYFFFLILMLREKMRYITFQNYYIMLMCQYIPILTYITIFDFLFYCSLQSIYSYIYNSLYHIQS